MAFREPSHEIRGPFNWTVPVHENISLLALRQALEDKQVTASSYKKGFLLKGVDLSQLPQWTDKDYVDPPDAPESTQEILRGVVWPDDPMCLLFDSIRGMKSYSSGYLWNEHFDASKVTDKTNLIARSHFGDLQFFHAMSPKLSEQAPTTKSKILMWANFSAGVALGQTTPDTELKKTGVSALFTAQSELTVRGLFAGGKKPGESLSDLDARHRATGILFHLIQDSHSASHVRRNKNWQIQQFHDYGSQDHKKHGKSDKMGSGKSLKERITNTSGGIKAVDVCSSLVLLLDSSASAATVATFFDTEVFPLAKDAQAAGPGDEYR